MDPSKSDEMRRTMGDRKADTGAVSRVVLFGSGSQWVALIMNTAEDGKADTGTVVLDGSCL